MEDSKSLKDYLMAREVWWKACIVDSAARNIAFHATEMRIKAFDNLQKISNRLTTDENEIIHNLDYPPKEKKDV